MFIGYIRDKLAPPIIVLIISSLLTYIGNIKSMDREDNRKSTDDRQDECIQDRIDHDRIQDSTIALILKYQYDGIKH